MTEIIGYIIVGIVIILMLAISINTVFGKKSRKKEEDKEFLTDSVQEKKKYKTPVAKKTKPESVFKSGDFNNL